MNRFHCAPRPSHLLLVFCICLPWGGHPAQLAAEPQVVQTLEQGRELQAEGKYLEAVNVYKGLTASPEAATREGICLAKLGRMTEALQAYERALVIGPISYWADVLFHKAEACLRSKDSVAARQCVERLRARFPESVWTVRAGIIEAELTGQDSGPAVAAYEQESATAAEYERAIRAASIDERLRLLDELLAHHPNSATALKVKASKGHLLWKTAQLREAIGSWKDVLERTVPASPDSRIAKQATFHIASLYRSWGEPEKARTYYKELLEKPEFADFAALSLMGLEFEELRRDHRLGKDISSKRETFLARCRAIMANPAMAPLTRVKAELRLCETYSWTGNYAEAVREAQVFVEKYHNSPYRNELLNARHFMGDGLARLHRWPEALEQFQAILVEEQVSGLQQPPVVHFRLWQALQHVNAPADEVQAAADSLLARFPDNEWAHAIQRAQEREAK